MIEQGVTLAIQKPNGKPNMGDESMGLLKAGGISYTFRPRVDDAPTSIPGLDLIAMRNGDIAGAVARGEADLGIVGLDMYKEYRGETVATNLKPLGFSVCTLKLGVKKDFAFTDPSSLRGLRVGTSYPNLTADFFRRWDTEVVIKTYQGGEEGFVKRGGADACVVISDTGDSLDLNGQKPVYDVLESQAMLIASPMLSEKRGSERIVWRTLRAIMTGLWRTQYTMLEANFLEPLTDEVLATLPALESPTVSPLQSGGQATRSLVPISDLEQSLARLYEAGASEVVSLEVRAVYPNIDDPEITRMMRIIYGKDWQLPNPPYLL